MSVNTVVPESLVSLSPAFKPAPRKASDPWESELPEAVAPRITVLTPTWNRRHTLPRLYESLCAQTFKDFEWLVVDDGSTDGTKDWLAALVRENRISIRVAHFPNGGKHRAINRALPLVQGTWTFIVDSDDLLPPNALASLERAALLADGEPDVCGVMGLKARLDGSRVGEAFPEGILLRDAATLTFIDRLRADKAEAFKTVILRRFPFPEFEGERFLTECVVWYRIAAAGFKLRLLDEVLYLCDYRPDGLSASSFFQRLANPEGNLLYYRESAGLDFPPGLLVRELINLLRFSLHGKRLRREVKNLPAGMRRMALLLMPAGVLIAISDRFVHARSFRALKARPRSA